MNRSLTIQITLLGLCLLAMLAGILFQQPIREEQHPVLQELVENAPPAPEGENDADDAANDVQQLILPDDNGNRLNITETKF